MDDCEVVVSYEVMRYGGSYIHNGELIYHYSLEADMLLYQNHNLVVKQSLSENICSQILHLLQENKSGEINNMNFSLLRMKIEIVQDKLYPSWIITYRGMPSISTIIKVQPSLINALVSIKEFFENESYKGEHTESQHDLSRKWMVRYTQ